MFKAFSEAMFQQPTTSTVLHPTPVRAALASRSDDAVQEKEWD